MISWLQIFLYSFYSDIYGQYECQITDPSLNVLKTNLIYPATEKHIEKYLSAKTYVIEGTINFIFIVCSISLIFVTLTETPSLYETVTLPFIKNEKFSVDWVYNILEHKKETERIGNKRGFTFSFVHTQHHYNFFPIPVYEDADTETGFVLLPDFKWNGKQVDDM